MATKLDWKLRRIAARLRQQDVASLAGMSTSRYSALERGEAIPTELDSKLIERCLPPMPDLRGTLERDTARATPNQEEGGAK